MSTAQFPLPNDFEDHTEECKGRRFAIFNALNNGIKSIPIDYGDISKVVCQGESKASVVYVVTYKNNSSRVFKFVDVPDEMVIEDHVLSVWNSIGVRVPKVYSCGNFNIDDFTASYMELEYIKGDNLFTFIRDKKESDDGYRKEMFEILKKIHSFKVNKFGDIKNDKEFSGDCDSLEEFLRKRYPKDIFNEVWNMQTDSLYGSLIEQISNTKLGITIEHGDFRAGNFILKENNELVLIDPNPSYNHPYFDIAYYMILNVLIGWDISIDDIDKLYRIDYPKELRTALILLGSDRLKKTEGIEKQRLQEFLNKEMELYVKVQ